MTVSLCRTRHVGTLCNASRRPRERDGRPGPKAAGVAKREDSYGPKSGPKAGSRASSPGEQAAACDCQKTRALGRGLNSSPQLATTKKLVRWATRAPTTKTSLLHLLLKALGIHPAHVAEAADEAGFLDPEDVQAEIGQREVIDG